LVVEFGNAVDPDVNRMVHALCAAVNEVEMPGVTEVVPTYRSLLVYYDPAAILVDDLERALREMVSGLAQRVRPAPKTTVVPVCYDPEYGPDLDDVARYNGLSREEVVAIHSGSDYLIYMLGFTPGFPYLHMSGRLSAPRLATPRKRVAAGSVGIAGSQTGVYTVDSPGGWRIIGRTPLRLYDPGRMPSVLLSAGDYVRFLPIGRDEYLEMVRGKPAGGGVGGG